jgi:hypothetical protein
MIINVSPSQLTTVGNYQRAQLLLTMLVAARQSGPAVFSDGRATLDWTDSQLSGDCSGYPPWEARPKLDEAAEAILSNTVSECMQKNGSASSCWGSQQMPLLESVPYLRAAADWLLDASCGYDFLLQPWMNDFNVSEYK